MNLEKKLSKEMNELLKANNMTASDFIFETASFPKNYAIRRTAKARELWKEAQKRNIIIWNL